MAQDTAPDNVGESINRSGEDVKKQEGSEAGRQDTGTAGGTDRPTGTSTARDATGIDPAGSESITDSSGA